MVPAGQNHEGGGADGVNALRTIGVIEIEIEIGIAESWYRSVVSAPEAAWLARQMRSMATIEMIPIAIAMKKYRRVRQAKRGAPTGAARSLSPL